MDMTQHESRKAHVLYRNCISAMANSIIFESNHLVRSSMDLATFVSAPTTVRMAISLAAGVSCSSSKGRNMQTRGCLPTIDQYHREATTKRPRKGTGTGAQRTAVAHLAHSYSCSGKSVNWS